jgi:uncharacterized protein YraI
MRRVGCSLLVVIMLACALGPGIGSPAPVQAAPRATSATTTDALNLRSGPSLSDGVIAVIPVGAQVTLTGTSSNGFRAVSWNGRRGWAFATYLAINERPASPHASAITTDALNLRSGAGTANGVLRVLPRGTRVTLTGKSSNGFRAVAYRGYSGWVSAEYIRGGSAPTTATPGGTAVTTDALNLRAGAGISHAVLAIMPVRSRVVLTGEVSGDFHAVSWNGRKGWASSSYLAIEGTAPAPPMAATTTDDLNLRSGPATSYGVVTMMPRGSRVTLTGQVTNGFHAVAFNGKSGWAFSAYLRPGSATSSRQPFATSNSIVGPVRGSADQAIGYARRAGAVRLPEVEAYIREIYRLAPQVGLDPALLVSQSALETGNWKSKWWRQRLNPAGLGITGNTKAHIDSQRFSTGVRAARAQIAHMHAEVYGSAQPLPAVLLGADVSYQNVFDAGWAGSIRTLADLSGTWAADPAYHKKIVRVAREIFT